MSQHIPDQVAIADLPERLGLSRSRCYDILTALKIQGRKVGRQSFLSGDQFAAILRCRDAIAAGQTLAEYVDRNPPELPVETAAGLVPDASGTPSTEQLMAAILALLQAQQQVAIAPAMEMPDTLAVLEQRLRILQLAADGGLSLPNAELADLLDLAPATLRGRADGFMAYGLQFRRQHQGRGIVWRVTRPVPDASDAR